MTGRDPQYAKRVRMMDPMNPDVVYVSAQLTFDDAVRAALGAKSRAYRAVLGDAMIGTQAHAQLERMTLPRYRGPVGDAFLNWADSSFPAAMYDGLVSSHVGASFVRETKQLTSAQVAAAITSAPRLPNLPRYETAARGV